MPDNKPDMINLPVVEYRALVDALVTSVSRERFYDDDTDELDQFGPEPCQPIGCDNGIHLPNCPYTDIDADDSDEQIVDLKSALETARIALSERYTQVAEKDSQIAELTSETESLRAHLSSTASYVGKFRLMVREFEGEISDLRSRMSGQIDRERLLRSEALTSRKEISAKGDRISDLMSKLKGRDEAIDALHSQRADMIIALAARDKVVLRLESEALKSAKEIKSLRASVGLPARDA